ncbi:MAG: chromosome segregation protein SMC [Kiloniellaceae bacterium]
MVQFTKLQLSGFKSFVDPTELFIEPGVSGIVGPNGCGKSNLIEALRWVMGESSAKRMRGAEMDDVIFSGSATRPPRNLAEATVVLDNGDRKAPAMFNDHETIEVVRRIERGCGSVYRVNGREVRARDVQLLFADAASGAHSTALVSQGRVGALINAKPADRRSLLDEAAGITGLHTRRHEAELRLRAAETNLERLDDVIATLETQLKGLRKQARQAARYRKIADQIRRNDAIALHLEGEAAKAVLRDAEGRLAAADRHVAALTERAAARATAQAEAAAALPELRHDEAAAAAALQRLLVDRDNLAREEVRVAAAKEQAEQRRTQLEGDQARAKALAEDAAAARARLDRERGALEAAAAGEAEAVRAAEDARSRALEAVNARESEVHELAERIAADEAHAGALQRRVDELSQRVQRLHRQADESARQREALAAAQVPEGALQAVAADTAAAEAALERARGEAEAAEAALGEARGAEAAAREALQHAEATRAKLDAEAAALTALLEPAEAKDWPLLLDAVAVEHGYEAALGAALGDDIAASTDAAAPVRWETLPPYDTPPPLPPGAEALSARVRGPAALARRLSQVGVVADGESGARLQPRLAPGQRLVTKTGALWRWDGFTVAADARTAAGKRLEQRNRLNELRGILAEAAGAAANARAGHEAARAALEEVAAAERAARDAVAGAFGTLNAARQRESGLTQEAAAVASRLAALDETAAHLAGDLAESEAALAAARAEAEALPDLDARRARLGPLRAALAEHRGELARCQSAFDRLTREAEARAQRLATIEEEKASWTRRSEEAEGYIVDVERRLEATGEEIVALAARPAELAALGESLAEQIARAEERRKQAADALAVGETRLAEADRGLKAEEQALAAAREDRVRAESAVVQAEQSLATVTEKVRERLDCRLEDVIEIAEVDPSQDLPGREEVAARLARLVRERENLGPVNLRAEAEAQELDRQINGMQSERADLISAIGRLRQGIASLNREGRERLLAAFEQVNAHFSELFVRLFGGGRAHLKLTEADDPLEAGLEILASPPGKRLQVMSLLSGGEQALTALSLLFAVFLTNPAPICVLDEVDAPLDDANVDRFCTLLDELSHSGATRFLVITHHRMTMARVDRLFGVTMSERGVSRLVSVDLGAAEDLRESA